MTGREMFAVGLMAIFLDSVVLLVARADPPHIINTDPVQTTDHVELCIGDFCKVAALSCAPGETCELPIDLPSGCYKATARVMSGDMVSERSNVLLNPRFWGALCHDGNADGRVSGSDWRSLWEAFNQSSDE